MRGRDTWDTRPCSSIGITPAYAGKRHVCNAPCKGMGDHPRVCGEKKVCASARRGIVGSPPRMRGKDKKQAERDSTETKRGSPPRMRGKVTGYFGVVMRIRITPAYAGKRLKRSHRIGHFSCILCLFHSVLHRASASGGSRAGPCAPPCLPAQNAVPV